MSRIFRYRSAVDPAWIDYNGHMQDAYYGLVFSYAVDAMQDAVGLDAAYRQTTGSTIYLLEDHKFFLREVKLGAVLEVETRVIGLAPKRFQLWSEMFADGRRSAVSELMELHVTQVPEPHGTPLPAEIYAQLEAALWPPAVISALQPRARGLQI